MLVEQLVGKMIAGLAECSVVRMEWLRVEMMAGWMVVKMDGKWVG